MKWISVKERLPEETEWVLVYQDGAMNCMAFNKKTKAFEDWIEAKCLNVIPEFITHWMPLPPKPEDVEE